MLCTDYGLFDVNLDSSRFLSGFWQLTSLHSALMLAASIKLAYTVMIILWLPWSLLVIILNLLTHLADVFWQCIDRGANLARHIDGVLGVRETLLKTQVFITL